MATDINPVQYDPTTGLSTYKVKGPSGLQSVQLFSIEHYAKDAPQGAALFSMDQSSYITRRLDRLNDLFAQNGLDAGFALDIAGSNLSDDEMVRFVRQRNSAITPEKKWWESIWNNPVTRGVATPLNYVYDHTMNAVARAVTNRDDATFHGLFALGIQASVGTFQGKDLNQLREEAGYDYDTGQFHDKETGNPISFQEWTSQQDNWFKAVNFGASLIDPTLLLGALGTLRHTAGVVRGTTRASRVTGKATIAGRLGLATDDAARIMRGELKVQDWFHGVKARDIIKSHYGAQTSVQHFVKAIDTARDPLTVSQLLRKAGKADPPSSFVQHVLKNNLANKGQGFVRTMEELWDPAQAGRVAGSLESNAARAAQVAEELAGLPKWANLSIKEYRAAPNAAEQALVRQRTGLLHAEKLTEEATAASTKLFDRALSLDDEVSALAHASKELLHEQRATSFLRRVPQRGMTDSVRAWYAGSDFAKEVGIWETHDILGTISSALKAVGRLTGRTLRGVTSMVPHAAVDVTSDVAHAQVGRLLNELELTSSKFRPIQSALGRKAVRREWTKEMSAGFYKKFVEAPDDLGRIQVLDDVQKSYLRHSLGFTPRQIEQVVREHVDSVGGRVFGRDALTGKAVRTPLSPADASLMVSILDVHTVRRLSRIGEREFTQGNFVRAVRGVVEKLQKAWKLAAVVRPAWAFRVVILSEQPRLAMAGLPNMMTHPLLAVASSQMRGVSRVAQTILEARIKTPVVKSLWRTQRTEILEGALSDTLKEIRNAGGVATKAGKRRRELGTGALAERYTPGWDPSVPATYKRADMEYATDKMYYEEGAVHVLNNVLATDPVALRWSQKATFKDVRRWARLDEEGIALRAKLGVADDGIDDWLRLNKARYEQFTKGLTSKEIGNLGNLKLADMPDSWVVPDEIPSIYWEGSLRRPGMRLSDNALGRMYNGIFHSFSGAPSFYLSRNGPLQYEWASEVLRLKGLSSADVDVQKLIKDFVGNPQKLSATERRIATEAYQNATGRVRQVVYDLNETARVADLARYVMPFGNAWQEEITRWAMLAWQRPHVPVMFANMWRNLEAAPFTFKDPRTGEDSFWFPGSSWATKWATGKGFNPITRMQDGVGFSLTGKWKAMNIVFNNNFLPGAGPWLQVPAYLAKEILHLPPGLEHMIDPYSGRTTLIDKIMPSAFYRAYKEQAASETYNQEQYASTVNAVVQYHLWKAEGDPTKIDIPEAERQAKALRIINAVAIIGVGSGITESLPPELAKMGSFLKWGQTNFPAAAERLFMERYGNKAAAFMTFYSKSLTGEPPTKEAEDLLLSPGMKPLADAHGRAFWALFSEGAKGRLDSIAYASQVARGDRQFQAGDDFLDAAMVNVGWFRYGQLKNEFAQEMVSRGIEINSDAYRAAKQVFDGRREVLFDAYPGFRDAWFSSKRDEWILHQRNLYQLVQDPKTNELQGAQGARVYFDMVRQLKAAMDARGIKSLEGKKVAPLKAAFLSTVNKIMLRYPSFQDVYYRLNMDNFNLKDNEMPWGVGVG